MTATEQLFDNLNKEQSSILKEFRERVSDVLLSHHDDFFLLRWLVAREFNIIKAEDMLRNHLIWRAKVGADTVLDDYKPPEVVKKYFTGGIVGQDKQGSVIWIDPFGNIDLKGLMKSAKRRDLEKYQIYMIEGLFRRFEILSKQQNRRISSIINIFDLKNFGLRHFWKPGVDLVTYLVSVFEDQYPETLKILFVVNAPTVFSIAYKILYPFLSMETRSKICVMGDNYKRKLLSHISPEQLPILYGGSRGSDQDPGCSAEICYGGMVPQSYYLPSVTSDTNENVTKEIVSRGSTLELSFSVSANSILQWRFTTITYDICFGIFHEENSSNRSRKPVVPLVRVNSHLATEDGSLFCSETGTYIVVFDNKYSWLHNKQVFYSIKILDSSN